MLISIIIPVFNEEKNIRTIFKEVKNTLAPLSFIYEIIFVNDGSTDSSSFIIDEIIKQDDKVKVIEFTRNFGKETALSAGLNYCKGDAAIMMDADLQHPADLIPQFISKWKSGALLVIGIRKSSYRNGILNKLTSWLYYKIINRISDIKIKPNSTDFRLMDRKVINEFNRLSEKTRMVRGLISWLGFEEDYIYFDAPKRTKGSAQYSFIKRIRLAVSSMVSLSLFPLKLAGYFGIVITLLSGTGGLFILIEQYILNDPLNLEFSGPAILAIIILFLVGIILICLGLIALYIANIQSEVINRPMYVIKKKNLD